jgi:hypothetical protein
VAREAHALCDRMYVKPGEWNWTQLVDLEDGLVDRMSRQVCMVVPLTDDPALMDAVEEDRLDDLLAAVDPGLVAALDQSGRPAVGRRADVGRGAGAVGIAIDLGEALATLGGAAAAIKGTVVAVRSAYRSLSRRLGRLPLVSLGAAEHLAAADVIDRHGADTFTLVGSGDVSSANHDRAFTGGDAFWIIFADESGSLHHYQVDSYGRVWYVGQAPPVANHWDPPPNLED